MFWGQAYAGKDTDTSPRAWESLDGSVFALVAYLGPMKAWGEGTGLLEGLGQGAFYMVWRHCELQIKGILELYSSEVHSLDTPGRSRPLDVRL